MDFVVVLISNSISQLTIGRIDEFLLGYSLQVLPAERIRLEHILDADPLHKLDKPLDEAPQLILLILALIELFANSGPHFALGQIMIDQHFL